MKNLELFRCDCGTNDHIIILEKAVWDDGENPECLVFSIALNDFLPWYSKIWAAILYVFGHNYKYGHFDEVILQKSEVNRLINILTKWTNA